MTNRRGTAVIVKVDSVTNDGAKRTVYYGPFLPHVGSATTSFVGRIEHELEESGRYRDWETAIESVFIGEDESDCAIQATR